MKSVQHIIFCILALFCIVFIFIIVRVIIHNNDTNNSQHYLDKGNLYFDTGNYKNAKKQYIAYKLYQEWDGSQKQRLTENCIVMLKEAEQYLSEKNFVSAKEKYQEVIRINPKDTNTLNQISICDQYLAKNNNAKNNNPPNLKNMDRKKIENIIDNYNKYIVNNDFQRLSKLFASTVTRFHDAYNKSRDYVIDSHRNYDSKNGVYGKRSSVRWNSLHIGKKNNLISIRFIQDFSIDRYDTSKFKNFVLEKHIDLNENYQIVSIYDKQISRSR